MLLLLRAQEGAAKRLHSGVIDVVHFSSGLDSCDLLESSPGGAYYAAAERDNYHASCSDDEEAPKDMMFKVSCFSHCGEVKHKWILDGFPLSLKWMSKSEFEVAHVREVEGQRSFTFTTLAIQGRAAWSPSRIFKGDQLQMSSDHLFATTVSKGTVTVYSRTGEVHRQGQLAPGNSGHFNDVYTIVARYGL